jgi:hypothetical protein
MVSDINALTRSAQAINNHLQVQRITPKSAVAPVEKLTLTSTQQSNGKDSATFSKEALTRLAAEESANKSLDAE